MGEFSYMCKYCRCPINSGDACIFALMIKGKIVESHKGFNSNYGYVEGNNEAEDVDEQWKYADWGDLVSLHFNKDKTTGFVMIHQCCLEEMYENGKVYWKPRIISKDDPNQGWGIHLRYEYRTLSKINLCSCQKIIFDKKHCGKVECIARIVAREV